MKKYIFLVWLLVLALTLASCIQGTPPAEPEASPAPDAPPTSDGTAENQPPSEPSAPTQPEDPAPSPPTIPSYPLWAEDAASANAFLSVDGIVDTSKKEYSYEEMVQDLSDLASIYPKHFSYSSFGKSVLGRELYVAVLGNESASQQILVSAGIHGREYLTPLLAMKQLEYYLAYYEIGRCNGKSYEELFGDVCIYIVPMTNPDGIMLSQNGLSSVSDPVARQKLLNIHMSDFHAGITKEPNITEYLKGWKANANGVDLNRNYDAKWNEYGGEKNPSHRNYKGSAPESEPETQAMVALIREFSNLQAVLCLHSQGEVLYWNCGQEPDLRDATQQFTKMVAQVTGYYIVPDQNNDASLSDWCELTNGIISITVETGIGVCPLPISQFSSIWQQNFNLIAKSAKYFAPNDK